MPDTYRDFVLAHDPPPIPLRSCDWSATHQDYDPSPVESGGPAGDDRLFRGPTREAVMAEVDLWHDEEWRAGR